MEFVLEKILKYILSIILVITISFAQNFDHSLFDKILKDNVSEKGMVNYESIKSNKEFDGYLSSIAKADVKNYSDAEKLAFYINAYNAYVIKNVLNNWPTDSPLSVKGFFKEFKFTVAEEELSLDEIEHKHVLTIEPLLSHFGLVCAALSCPKLVRKAYTNENVYNLLVENGKIFLNDSFKNRLDRENNTLHLSQIFNWFGDTFKKKHGDLVTVAKKYINEDDKNYLSENEVNVKFVKYDWTLNKQ